MSTYFEIPDVPFKSISILGKNTVHATRLGKLVYLTAHAQLLPFGVAMRWIDLLAKPDWGECWNFVFANIASHHDTSPGTTPNDVPSRLWLSAVIAQSIKDFDEARCAKILGEIYAALEELNPVVSFCPPNVL